MISILRTIFLIAGIAILGAAGPLSVALADTSKPWMVAEVTGSARFGAEGTGGQPARTGATLSPGDTVSTGSDGKLVLARGDERITLSPSSEVGLPAENTGPYSTRILQNLGTILLKVDRKPSQHFEVQTPYMAAVVKGTTFTVSVDAQGTAVHVVEGAVQVADLSGVQVQVVRPGQTATLSSTPGATLSVDGVGAPAAGPGEESGAVETEQGETDAAAPGDASGDTTAGGKTASRNDRGRADAPGQARKASPAIDSAVGTVGVDLAVATDGLVTGTAGKSGVTPNGRGSAQASRGASAGNRAGGNGASNSAGGGAQATQAARDVSTIVVAANPGNGNSGNGNGNGNSGNGNGGNGNGNSGNGNGGNGNGNSGNGNGGNGNGNSGNGNGGNGNGNSGNGNGNSGNGNGNGNSGNGNS